MVLIIYQGENFRFTVSRRTLCCLVITLTMYSSTTLGNALQIVVYMQTNTDITNAFSRTNVRFSCNLSVTLSLSISLVSHISLHK